MKHRKNAIAGTNSFIIVSLCFGIALLASCGGYDESDHRQTAQSGIKTLPWPKEMETLFGEGDHFITHYGLSSDPKTWNSEVFFYGKYTLTCQAEVSINYRKHAVEKIASSPKFYLWEIGSVEKSGGGWSANISAQWILNEAQWKKLVQAKGDWSVLGIPVQTNSPVPSFDDYAKALRAPRDNIPH